MAYSHCHWGLFHCSSWMGRQKAGWEHQALSLSMRRWTLAEPSAAVGPSPPALL